MEVIHMVRKVELVKSDDIREEIDATCAHCHAILATRTRVWCIVGEEHVYSDYETALSYARTLDYFDRKREASANIKRLKRAIAECEADTEEPYWAEQVSLIYKADLRKERETMAQLRSELK